MSRMLHIALFNRGLTMKNSAKISLVSLLIFLCVAIQPRASAVTCEPSAHYTLLDVGSKNSESNEIDMDSFNVGDMYIGPPPSDLMVKSDYIRLNLPLGTDAKVGSVVECKGFSRKCFVLFQHFKIALGDDFSFDTTSKWQWEGFKYIASSKREVSILGKTIEAVEVNGQQMGENPLFVTFFISPGIGVFYLKMDTGGAVYTYILGSQKGIWALD